jgi:uncharacterized 2Fe-2S/4Fe-4S cluster protein (DUF4445 family)
VILLPLKILFNPLGKVVEAENGENLLDVMRREGVRIEALCGGKGECGKCRVILEEGKIEKKSLLPDKFLHPMELEEGYHLACMVTLQSDCVFTIPTESRIENPKILLTANIPEQELDPSSQKFLTEEPNNGSKRLLIPFKGIKLRNYKGIQPRTSEEILNKFQAGSAETVKTATVSRTGNFPEIIDIETGNTLKKNYGLAIDIGTTTIVGLLVDLNTGNIVSRASEINRQITFGEELVTRIAFARKNEGLLKLHKIVIETINDVIDHLIRAARVQSRLITDITISGNTVMNHLFAGIDSSYLEEANVEVSRDPIILKSRSLGLNTHPEAYVYCLPNVSRFLGGDAIGDVITSNIHKSDEMNLIVDLGTNGEIIFGNRSWLFSSSCASGPAFEGEGVRHGMRAAKGGIDHVNIDPKTYKAQVSVIGGGRPKGICGSGLIDLVAELYSVGLMDFAGKFVPGKSLLIREGKWGLEYLVVLSEETDIEKDIVLTQIDLNYVIDSKAAACGAITVLMKKLKISINDVKHVYLAGAFGAYSDLKNSIKLGIFPEFLNAQFHPIGNGSLAGAYLTLISMEKRREAKNVAVKTVYIDLLVDIEFMDEYSKALYIPGAKEYFPTYFRNNNN